MNDIQAITRDELDVLIAEYVEAAKGEPSARKRRLLMEQFSARLLLGAQPTRFARLLVAARAGLDAAKNYEHLWRVACEERDVQDQMLAAAAVERGVRETPSRFFKRAPTPEEADDARLNCINNPEHRVAHRCMVCENTVILERGVRAVPIDEILTLVATEHRTGFLHFLETGDMSPEFEAYLDASTDAQRAVDLAIDRQVKALQELSERIGAARSGLAPRGGAE